MGYSKRREMLRRENVQSRVLKPVRKNSHCGLWIGGLLLFVVCAGVLYLFHVRNAKIDRSTNAYGQKGRHPESSLKSESAKELSRGRSSDKESCGVQLWEDGPYWATCNLGATKPEEYGTYFWWGETEGRGYKSCELKDRIRAEQWAIQHKSYSDLQDCGAIDSNGKLMPALDAATFNLGSPWRMPTREEFAALIDNCSTKWSERNGVRGLLVTGKGEYSTCSIFLPAAGIEGALCAFTSPGTAGGYWSSCMSSGRYHRADYLYFDSSRTTCRYGYYSNCGDGRPIRPVYEKPSVKNESPHKQGEKGRKHVCRKSEESGEEKIAEECEKLTNERLDVVAGGKDIWEFYCWRKSIWSYYDGLERFVSNFERMITPIPDQTAWAIDVVVKRKELYGKYKSADEVLRTTQREFCTTEKQDEFETKEEYKARVESERLKIGELERKRDEALDAIVALEEASSQRIHRRAINGFYVMDEALIFIPKTDWKFNAEERQFVVKGKEIKSYNWFDDDRKETIQGFHFSARGIPVTQFVKSNMIDFKYKMADGVWVHPRVFKKYKQNYPFLLVRLGPCDFKVQGITDRIVTMSWKKHPKSKNEGHVKGLLDPNYGRRPGDNERAILARDVDNPYLRSAILDQARTVWRKAETEVRQVQNSDSSKVGVTLFETKTYDDYRADELLPAIDIFADYKTLEGRAEIENVLKHFEATGGAYYKEFCMAVRLMMERKTPD